MAIVEPDGTVKYEGLVAETGSVADAFDSYDTSYYARVWDPETRSLKHVWTGSTRPGSKTAGAVIDASPEIYQELAEQAEKQALADWWEKNLEQAQTPMTGRWCLVVRGRKVKPGTHGECFWLGREKNGEGWRVGLKQLSGEAVFVPLEYAVTLDPGQWLRPEAEAQQTMRAAGQRWRSLALAANSR